MKNRNPIRIAVLLLICFFKLKSSFAIATYNFSSSNGTYSPILNGQQFGTPGNVNGCYYDSLNPTAATISSPVAGNGFSIGFNFKFDTLVYTRFIVCSKGWLMLGIQNTSVMNGVLYGFDKPFADLTPGISSRFEGIAAFAGKLVANPNSSLSYKVIGAAPNRTLVVQWEKFSRSVSLSDTINFQICLYENSNKIEAVYGPMQIGNVASNMQVGLSFGYRKQARSLAVDWNISQADTMHSAVCTLGAQVMPNQGLTFTWTPPPNCTSPPIAGSAVAAVSSTCGYTPLNFFLFGNSDGVGQSFQWQKSTDQLTWTNIPNSIFTSCVVPPQSVSTYYRCAATCSGQTSYSQSAFVYQTPSNQCYCISTAQNQIGSDISEILMDSLYYGTSYPLIYANAMANEIYLDNTALPAKNFHAGTTYTMKVNRISSKKSFVPYTVVAFIDFNNNFTFENSTERFVLGEANTFMQPDEITGSILIPLTTSIGNKRMRIILVDNPFVAITGCYNYNQGETIDFTINIIPSISCSGQPIAGVASSSLENVNISPTTWINLKISGYSKGSGTIYQWQSSPDGINWSNLLNVPLAPAISFQALSPLYYRCKVSCSTLSDFSNAVFIPCHDYCTSGATTTIGPDVGKFQFAGDSYQSASILYSSSNSLATQTYSNFTNKVFSVRQGETKFSITTVISSTAVSTNSVYVQADFNNDGTFTSDEYFSSTVNTQTSDPLTYYGTIPIPFNSQLGEVRLRVTARNGLFGSCGAYTQGETEDYTLLILPSDTDFCQGISGTTLSSSALQVCPGKIVDFTITNPQQQNSGFIYTWEYSSDSLNWVKLATSLLNTFNDTIVSTQYYRSTVHCTDGSVDISNVVKERLEPLPNCYCLDNLGGSNCAFTTRPITNVTIPGTTLNNSYPTCTLNASYSSINTFAPTAFRTGTLIIGNTYNLSVTTYSNDVISAWIDFNANGEYEASEWFLVSDSSIFAVPSIISITVPWGSTPGLTGMRIRNSAYGSQNAAADACTNFTSGETEEYKITLGLSTGFTNPNLENGIVIYPNPAKDIITIAIQQNKSEKSHLEIYTVKGQLIYEEGIAKSKTVVEKTIDISRFQKGLYILRWITDDRVFTKKIVFE
ncbi:MAG: T9SS type A sorting domain-containing protein [Bacteroidetes bacterium]|nr:T9SS type A sorting domain-containing protein [Bacteroidota bacterium]